VLTAVTPATPRARSVVLRQHGLAEVPATRLHPARTAIEWRDLMHVFDRADRTAPVGVALEGAIDEVAALGGWSHAPAGERLARYSTLYGAPNMRAAWICSGWSLEPTTRDRLDRYLASHPAVPMRDLQTIAHFLK